MAAGMEGEDILIEERSRGGLVPHPLPPAGVLAAKASAPSSVLARDTNLGDGGPATVAIGEGASCSGGHITSVGRHMHRYTHNCL